MTISLLKPIVKKDFGVKRTGKRFALTENLVVTLWQGKDGHSLSPFRFRLDRVNPQDTDRPFHTLHAQDLLEFPQLAASLAGAFAGAENICPDVKWHLRVLADLMGDVELRLQDEDPYKGNPGSPMGALVE